MYQISIRGFLVRLWCYIWLHFIISFSCLTISKLAPWVFI
ncbi:UNVERIFIED_ORG: hypothetical protein C7429_102633 [Pantoea allii]